MFTVFNKPPCTIEETYVNFPWLRRVVKSQITISFQVFVDTLLPEYAFVPTGRNQYIADTIRKCSGADSKKSFARLFNTFTECPRRQDLDGVMAAETADLKVPDCALVEIDLDDVNSGWYPPYCMYRAKEEWFKDAWHFLAKKASEAMSTGVPRNHIYGVYVKKDHAYFLYYDHSAVIVSEPMNWNENPHSFWKVIHTLSKIRLDRIGLEANLITFPALEIHLDRLDFKFIGVAQTSEHVIGESTSMIHARIRSGLYKDQIVTIKFSYVPEGKGWKYEEHVVTPLRQKVPDVADSLPVVIASKAFPSTEMAGRIHMLLGDVYQARELRVTVYAGELFPVTSLTNHSDMLRVFRDVMRVQKAIYMDQYLERKSLFHRALSPGNILFRRARNKIKGILIGFELSARCDEIAAMSAPSCLQSVESLAFVSPDILNNHSGLSILSDCCRYELQSVYYVLFFIVTHYESGKRISRIKAPFDVWFGDDHALSGSSKVANLLKKRLHFQPTSTLAKLEDKLRGLHGVLHFGYEIRKIPRCQDSRTFSGISMITYDRFFAELFREIRMEDMGQNR